MGSRKDKLSIKSIQKWPKRNKKYKSRCCSEIYRSPASMLTLIQGMGQKMGKEKENITTTKRAAAAQRSMAHLQ